MRIIRNNIYYTKIYPFYLIFNVKLFFSLTNEDKDVIIL